MRPVQLSGNIFQMDENRRVDTWNTIRRVAQELAEIGDEVNESYNIDSKVRGALDDALHVYGSNLSLEIQAEDSFSCGAEWPIQRITRSSAYHFGFDRRLTWNPAESLDYDVLQPKVLHQAPLCFSWYDIPVESLAVSVAEILRQPTTGFALLGVHQVGAVSEFQGRHLPAVFTKMMSFGAINGSANKPTTINLFFMGDSTKSLVCDIVQMNVLHKGHLMFQLWLERDFTDRKIRGSNPTSATRLPLSRLEKTGIFLALRVTWRLCTERNVRLTEPWGLRLTGEPQKGRNRSWAVE
ncbi:hypothetical protein CSKR_111214 [Clonorchis sinensis]|uniref:Uncharacterized protein n=1 Tax=Clonorchis sinensis TaxID=79923 RepID=A0A419QGC2_CLOSI|nr:hypothetical protein CSKR_111214 [Clonorchis sinensis]